jgi:hypothetical protein
VKTTLFVLSISVLLCISTAAVTQSPSPPETSVQLEMALEVATTTPEGLPAALRFTLKNIGYSAVDLPLPALDCSGNNGTVRIRAAVHHERPETGGYGHGCMVGTDHEPSLVDRVRTQWFHLLPGEYLTLTGDRRQLVDKAEGPATYEFWAEYEPPPITKEERNELAQAGYMVPSVSVESDHLSYSER